MSVSIQIVWLFILAIPTACIAWTVTQEEVFREPRDYCITHCKTGKSIVTRKFFYLFTCGYCFSHYIAALLLLLTNYHLLLSNWGGYLIAEFALVWLANVYMSLFALLRQDLKKEKREIEIMEDRVA